MDYFKTPVLINSTAWIKLTDKTKVHNKSKPPKINKSKVLFVKILINLILHKTQLFRKSVKDLG